MEQETIFLFLSQLRQVWPKNCTVKKVKKVGHIDKVIKRETKREKERIFKWSGKKNKITDVEWFVKQSVKLDKVVFWVVKS